MPATASDPWLDEFLRSALESEGHRLPLFGSMHAQTITGGAGQNSPTSACMFAENSDRTVMTHINSASHAVMSELTSIVEDPVTAHHISGQLKGRKAEAPKNQASGGIVCKKAAPVRGHHKVAKLQQQVEDMTQRVNDLTFSNQKLQLKEEILDMFIETMVEHSRMVLQANEDVLEHEKNPSLPPKGAAVFKDMTVEQFIGHVNCNTANLSKWVIDPSSIDRPEVREELSNMCKATQAAFQAASILQPDLIRQAQLELLKQSPIDVPEEAHWLGVVQALRLTPEQYTNILIAREIYCSIYDRLGIQQLSSAGPAEPQPPPAQRTALESVEHFEGAALGDVLTLKDKERVSKMASAIRREKTLLVVTAEVVYNKLLNPMQGALLPVHAHPFFPTPIIVLNAVAMDYRQRQQPLQQTIPQPKSHRPQQQPQLHSPSKVPEPQTRPRQKLQLPATSAISTTHAAQAPPPALQQQHQPQAPPQPQLWQPQPQTQTRPRLQMQMQMQAPHTSAFSTSLAAQATPALAATAACMPMDMHTTTMSATLPFTTGTLPPLTSMADCALDPLHMFHDIPSQMDGGMGFSTSTTAPTSRLYPFHHQVSSSAYSSAHHQHSPPASHHSQLSHSFNPQPPPPRLRYHPRQGLNIPPAGPVQFDRHGGASMLHLSDSNTPPSDTSNSTLWHEPYMRYGGGGELAAPAGAAAAGVAAWYAGSPATAAAGSSSSNSEGSELLNGSWRQIESWGDQAQSDAVSLKWMPAMR